MNRYIIGILKKMTKNPNIRKTESWTESKNQMLLILTRQIQKIKVDDHFKNAKVNDIHMGTLSWVS